LAFGPLAHWKLFGKDLFLLLDFITSNLLMPLVEIAVALFAGWVAWPHVETELRNGGAASWWLAPMRFFLRFVAPVLIAIVLVNAVRSDA
ncbi:MAG: hypothetical protein LBV28_03045, partial [Puniceicoccales bacterium]|jgi:NSS family neurotransmitter:Na+ symporter|nr:hypothetical protein [Puniceicoccales bacterium]